MAGKVHKTLRLESSLDDAVRSLKREGESDNAAYARVLQAGVAALLADVSASTDVSTHEHKSEHTSTCGNAQAASDVSTHEHKSEHTDEHTQKALVAALQAHIGALESESADLRSWLDLAQEHEREMADALAQQAATASRLAEQAQMLQAAQMKTAHPWRARLAGLVHGKRKDGEE
jgi:plasmid stabilization system protein ParE